MSIQDYKCLNEWFQQKVNLNYGVRLDVHCKQKGLIT